MVLLRGKIPCDILFIGEAPGPGENVIGQPFVGPAGHLLDSIIEQSIYKHNQNWRVSFTNLVGCIPLGDDNKKFTEPPKESILACQPRLIEIVKICNPQMIVRTGKLSTKHVAGWEMFGIEPVISNQMVDIIHPAAILRADVSQRGLLTQQAIITLTEAVNELVPF